MPQKRLLIIDDDEDIRAVAQLSLELTGGWQVLTAGSGQEGLALAAAQQPEVILLDVMMPEMDGPTTFQKLQEEPATCHIPVILLTAKDQSADRRQFAALGVRAVIAKPFDPLTLASEIATALG